MSSLSTNNASKASRLSCSVPGGAITDVVSSIVVLKFDAMGSTLSLIYHYRSELRIRGKHIKKGETHTRAHLPAKGRGVNVERNWRGDHEGGKHKNDQGRGGAHEEHGSRVVRKRSRRCVRRKRR
jgi:hypothetical protein